MMTLTKRAAAVGLTLVLCVAAARLSVELIPFDMDEFIHFHALGCLAFPQSRALSGFDESCRALELTLPFSSTPLPLRSYAYNGSLPSIVFWPFWLAFKDPVSARVQGFFFLALLTLLISRISRTSLLSSALAVLVLPTFAFSLIVDLGATGFSLTAGAIAVLCLDRALQAPRTRNQVLWGLAAGLACASGAWAKLVFVWFLPGLAFWALARVAKRPEARPALWRAGLALTLVLGSATALLVFSRDSAGRPFKEVLSYSEPARKVKQVRRRALMLVDTVLDGTSVMPEFMRIPPASPDGLPRTLAVLLILYGLASPARSKVGVFLVAGLLSLMATATSQAAWGPHHVAFGAFFVVLALASALDRLRTRRSLAFGGASALVALVLGGLLYRLPQADIDPRVGFAKDRLLNSIRRSRLDSQCLQVHVSWGTYYISHLFGSPEQAVAFSRRHPLDASDADLLRESAGDKRCLLVVSEESEPRPALEAALGPARTEYREGSWRARLYDLDPGAHPTLGRALGGPG
ncbi:MAG: hypothetical protein ABI565_08085 [Vicinamibacteria bacterium]